MLLSLPVRPSTEMQGVRRLAAKQWVQQNRFIQQKSQLITPQITQ